jgi:acetolactate synthase regulatory subunit
MMPYKQIKVTPKIEPNLIQRLLSITKPFRFQLCVAAMKPARANSR